MLNIISNMYEVLPYILSTRGERKLLLIIIKIVIIILYTIMYVICNLFINYTYMYTLYIN